MHKLISSKNHIWAKSLMCNRTRILLSCWVMFPAANVPMACKIETKWGWILTNSLKETLGVSHAPSCWCIEQLRKSNGVISSVSYPLLFDPISPEWAAACHFRTGCTAKAFIWAQCELGLREVCVMECCPFGIARKTGSLPCFWSCWSLLLKSGTWWLFTAVSGRSPLWDPERITGAFHEGQRW